MIGVLMVVVGKAGPTCMVITKVVVAENWFIEVFSAES